MKQFRIEDLQNELKELNKMFDFNIKMIEILQKYTSENKDFSKKLPPILSPEESLREKLRFIEKNYIINSRRIEIYKALKERQIKSKEGANFSSDDNFDSSGDYEKFSFLTEWLDIYSNKNDFLMVEIIELLNN